MQNWVWRWSVKKRYKLGKRQGQTKRKVKFDVDPAPLGPGELAATDSDWKVLARATGGKDGLYAALLAED